MNKIAASLDPEIHTSEDMLDYVRDEIRDYLKRFPDQEHHIRNILIQTNNYLNSIL